MSIQSRYHSEIDAAVLEPGALIFGAFAGRKGVLRVKEYLGTYPDGTVMLNAEEGGEGGPLHRAVVVAGFTPVQLADVEPEVVKCRRCGAGSETEVCPLCTEEETAEPSVYEKERAKRGGPKHG